MEKEISQKDVIYDAQFKQKVNIAYYPLTWQSCLVVVFLWMLPVNLMEAGGLYIFSGYLIYRMFVAKRDHEVEELTLYKFAVGFLKWVEKNKEMNYAVH